MQGTVFLTLFNDARVAISLKEGLCCHLNAQDVMQHRSLSN